MKCNILIIECVLIFCSRGSETVLGEMSHPQEVFMIYECADWPIHKIAMKIDIKVELPPPNWFKLGGVHDEKKNVCDNEKTFFVKKG